VNGPNGSPAAAAGEITLGGDLTVRRMGFGAMRITGDGIWGDPADPGAARALLRHVVEVGVNFIDTADSYGPEVSERLIREALHPYPEGVVIATKGGLLRDGPSQWRPDCRPEHLKEACEASLRRLRLDTIDLYQLHTPDPQVPFEESVGALSELHEEGKIRHVGLSNVGRSHLAKAREIVPIVSIQNRYSVTSRDSEEVLKTCEEDGLAFIPWFPLDTGSLATTDALEEIAGRHGVKSGQVALAWLLLHSPVMVPIPGTSSIEHLDENVAAAALQLSADELAQVEEAAVQDAQ
jgi:aryl-alcohol dehydrogenase-like predicted oxidoreductase